MMLKCIFSEAANFWNASVSICKGCFSSVCNNLLKILPAENLKSSTRTVCGETVVVTDLFLHKINFIQLVVLALHVLRLPTVPMQAVLQSKPLHQPQAMTTSKKTSCLWRTSILHMSTRMTPF